MKILETSLSLSLCEQTIQHEILHENNCNTARLQTNWNVIVITPIESLLALEVVRCEQDPPPQLPLLVFVETNFCS
jgi:hypothetical protein